MQNYKQHYEAVRIDTKRILMALDEREKWVRRKEELTKALKSLPRAERKTHKEEILRIDQEISYYDGLIREMKGDMAPNHVNIFLKNLNRA